MNLLKNSQAALLLSKIDARPQRERALILAVGVVLIWALFHFALFQPQQAAVQSTMNTLESIKRQIVDWQTQASGLKTAHKGTSVKEAAEKKQELEKQLSLADKKLKEVSQHLIPPEAMTGLLEEVLRADKALQLVDIRTSPAKSLFSQEKTKEEKEEKEGAGSLFVHPLVLIFEGGYFETLGYLQKIEHLHWRFFWDEVEYTVTNYPKARVTVKLHTVSEHKSALDI